MLEIIFAFGILTATLALLGGAVAGAGAADGTAEAKARASAYLTSAMELLADATPGEIRAINLQEKLSSPPGVDIRLDYPETAPAGGPPVSYRVTVWLLTRGGRPIEMSAAGWAMNP